MEAQSYTAEQRRAANQVWAAAGAYGFEPLFLAHNTDGTIDFYMNCIVGLVHKYYGDDLIRSLFGLWDGDIREAELDDLTWLYLESAAYALELPRRPVLAELRRAHAVEGIREGTLISALLTGIIARFYLRHLSRIDAHGRLYLAPHKS